MSKSFADFSERRREAWSSGGQIVPEPAENKPEQPKHKDWVRLGFLYRLLELLNMIEQGERIDLGDQLTMNRLSQAPNVAKLREFLTIRVGGFTFATEPDQKLRKGKTHATLVDKTKALADVEQLINQKKKERNKKLDK